MGGWNMRRSVTGGLLALALAMNLAVGARIHAQEAGNDDRDDPYELIAVFTRVVEQVRRAYVDTDRTRYRELVHAALRGMLQSLDEHSQFMDADQFSDLQDDTAGQFGGLGVVVGVRENVLTIVAPMENTPGFRAGLLAGDRILAIDGEATEGLSLSDAVRKMRGEPGTRIELRIGREGADEPFDVELVRAVISPPSVTDARMLDDGIGYLRIAQFNEPAADAVADAIRTLQGEGMHALVLDLRNNPGGLLRSAIEVAQHFLPRGALVVYTQGRDERQRQTFNARRTGRYQDLPMVILVNRGTASAAEIVAGALQDHGRAMLIGEQTFGKGSVQTVLPLQDGSAIRLTTARYYTPGEQVIDGRGVEPDVRVVIDPETWLAIQRRRAEREGAPPGEDEPAVDPDDPQLERAVDVLRGVLLWRAQNGGAPAG